MCFTADVTSTHGAHMTCSSPNKNTELLQSCNPFGDFVVYDEDPSCSDYVVLSVMYNLGYQAFWILSCTENSSGL